MSKTFELHQLLATVSTREGQAAKLMKEAASTFANKDSHFNGRMKTYHPDDDSVDNIVDSEEIVNMVYTVKDKLKYIRKTFANSVDTVIAKEETNSSGSAKAMLTFGNETVELSATALLALEKRIRFLREVYNTIPTLDPTKVWTYDDEKGFYKTDPVNRNRLVKKKKTVVVVPATDKFPAQTDVVVTDEKVGHYEEEHYSSKLSVRDKADMLDRVDKLLDSISLARAKANKCEVVERPIMNKIFSYVNGE